MARRRKNTRRDDAPAAPGGGEAESPAGARVVAVDDDGVPVADLPPDVTLPNEAFAAETAPGDAALVELAPDDGAAAAGPEGAAPGGDSAAVQGAAAAAAGPAEGDGPTPAVESGARLESIVESLIFASDRALTLSELKRLLGERDGKKITAALEAVQARHAGGGVLLVQAAGAWQFRTSPDNVFWVSKLVAGRPVRMSRAMLETLAIVAYRQPVTRPEVDEIRGVDCGPVLGTLLERGLVRIIGKKEEVGRPLLYGTTDEFLRVFSLKDLTALPSLREFHELTAADQARVDAEAPAAAGGASPEAGAPAGEGATGAGPPLPEASALPASDPDEEDELLRELEGATDAASRASAPLEKKPERKPRDATADEAGEDAAPGTASTEG